MTSHTIGLYYPRIDIRDDRWLKNSFLYWDEIRTIVPETMKDDIYNTPTSAELYKRGFLKPFNVYSDSRIVQDASKEMLKLSNSQAWKEFLTEPQEHVRFNIQKISYELFQSLPDMYDLPHLTRDPRTFDNHFPIQNLQNIPSPYDYRETIGGDSNEWYMVSKAFSDGYLSLLATRIAEDKGYAIITDKPSCKNITDTSKLTSEYNLHWDYRSEEKKNSKFYEELELSHGSMLNFTLEQIDIDTSSTPVSKLIKFKKKHSDELRRYRNAISDLYSKINWSKPKDNVSQQIGDIYENKVKLGLNDLQKSLDDVGIRYVVEKGLTMTVFSTGVIALLAAIPLSTPLTFGVGGGLSLAAAYILYRRNRKEKLRNNPYSYLYSLHRRFKG